MYSYIIGIRKNLKHQLAWDSTSSCLELSPVISNDEMNISHY